MQPCNCIESVEIGNDFDGMNANILMHLNDCRSLREILKSSHFRHSKSTNDVEQRFLVDCTVLITIEHSCGSMRVLEMKAHCREKRATTLFNEMIPMIFINLKSTG